MAFPSSGLSYPMAYPILWPSLSYPILSYPMAYPITYPMAYPILSLSYDLSYPILSFLLYRSHLIYHALRVVLGICSGFAARFAGLSPTLHQMSLFERERGRRSSRNMCWEGDKLLSQSQSIIRWYDDATSGELRGIKKNLYLYGNLLFSTIIYGMWGILGIIKT